VYLLNLILNEAPDSRGDSAADIATILSQTTVAANGMMGDSWLYSEDNGFNSAAQTLISQVQEGGLCVLSPDQLATCSNPLQSLDTWRDRVRGADQCS
jgi:hypothetical protein